MNQVQPYQPTAAPNYTPVVAHEAAAPSIATTLKDESWTLKEKIVYGLLAAVGIGGTIWIGKKLILKAISNKEELKSELPIFTQQGVLKSECLATLYSDVFEAFPPQSFPGIRERTPLIRAFNKQLI